MNKYYQTLELNKVFEQLKEDIVLESNKKYLDTMPLMSEVDDVQNALNEVDEATKLIHRIQRIPIYFNSPIDYLISRIKKNATINIEELLEFYKFFDTIRNIEVYVDSLEDANIDYSILKENISELFYPKELNVRIKSIVTPYGEIKDDATTVLKDIRKKIKDTERNIQNKLQEILSKNSSKLSQVVISLRNDRYVIPVKHDYKNMFKGIIHDQSASGETVFIEPQVICDLNNTLNQLKESEKKEIHNILREISDRIYEIADLLIVDYQIIAHLDLVFSKASYAIRINATKPKVNNKGIVDLINCHHPLLNVEKVVSNNINIGVNYQGIIITGPNTGGKTVLLKTIGLLSLMIKAGLLIPCDEESNIMVFDNVFADIGDEQSIDQNLSTFSSHLKNVILIMNSITNNSLVLLDELGSGTDPAEGSSLAIAIFDYLISKHCLVIATSHYSELKIHAYKSNNIINASVEFDVETLKPTYKLLIGIPGQSNALKISKMLGLPDVILEKAENYVNENNNEINVVLDKLIKQSHELDKKLKMIDEKNVLLNNKLLETNKVLEETYENKNLVLKKAEEEARVILSKSQKKIDEILEELNEMKLKEVKLHQIAEVKHEVKKLKESIKVQEEYLDVDAEIKVNDSVFVEGYNCYGVVLKINKDNKYDVQIGNAKITVNKAKLKLSLNNKSDLPHEYKNTNKSNLKITKNVKASLDLRGERYEDAVVKLEKYIDDAIYVGLMQVSIIHGFGTGVIREMVQGFLKKNKNVESYRYGGMNEGGQGATIVTLKK